MLGPEMFKEMEEMVKKVRSNLKATHDRQKDFVDRKRKFKEYQVGDHVYVRIREKRARYNGAGVLSWHPDFVDLFKSWQELGW